MRAESQFLGQSEKSRPSVGELAHRIGGGGSDPVGKPVRPGIPATRCARQHEVVRVFLSPAAAMSHLVRSAKRAFTSALEARGYSSAMVAEAKREGRWWLQARARASQHGSGLLEGRVILWNDGGTRELVPAEVARAGKGEVTIETIVSAVSPGTERAQFLRLPNAQISLPYPPGYSLAGRVVDVGRGVPAWSRATSSRRSGLPTRRS